MTLVQARELTAMWANAVKDSIAKTRGRSDGAKPSQSRLNRYARLGMPGDDASCMEDSQRERSQLRGERSIMAGLANFERDLIGDFVAGLGSAGPAALGSAGRLDQRISDRKAKKLLAPPGKAVIRMH